MPRKYFWQATLLSSHIFDNWEILSIMCLLFDSLGGIATGDVLERYSNELKNVNYDIAQFTEVL